MRAEVNIKIENKPYGYHAEFNGECHEFSDFRQVIDWITDKENEEYERKTKRNTQ